MTIMGYFNPLLNLPAARKLLDLDPAVRATLRALLLELREQADVQAEESWRRRKGPMAAYWRAVATYARHVAHVLTRDSDSMPMSGMARINAATSALSRLRDDEIDEVARRAGLEIRRALED